MLSRKLTRNLQSLSGLLAIVIPMLLLVMEPRSKAYGNITDPRDLVGNVLWLDASDVDGDFVAVRVDFGAELLDDAPVDTDTPGGDQRL